MSALSHDTVVLKFGSSVLKSKASLPIAVAEIYRHYRYGCRVIAVVSAFAGETDRLLAETTDPTAACSEEADSATVAVALATGEIFSAAQLVFALHRAGVPAQYMDPRDIELTAEWGAGDRLNAELTGLNLPRLLEILHGGAVQVVPGFFAQAKGGGPALLGRGGTDLTALYLAAELRAPCVLLKDVEGLYESDPATAKSWPRRFEYADYATAQACAGPLVQPKAVRFAQDRALTLELTRVGAAHRTRIGADVTLAKADAPARRIRVALLGLGTVGAGVLEYLRLFPERFELVAALVRFPEKHAAMGLSPGIVVAEADEVFDRAPEIVVEALPWSEIARSCVQVALGAGLRVVTANKALLALERRELLPYLVGSKRALRYAASVGGAVPMLEAVEGIAAHSNIMRFRGVLNGTCNFILDRCSEGMHFAEALKMAQQQGFAEANPESDLSGLDTARKTELLGRIAFGGIVEGESPHRMDESTVRAAQSELATGSGAILRFVAEAHLTAIGFRYSVGLRSLPADDYLARPRGVENRLEVTTRSGAVYRYRGLGAGRVPTATAMFADLLEHARVLDAERSEVAMLEAVSECSAESLVETPKRPVRAAPLAVLTRPDMLTAAQLSERLSWTRELVDKRRAAGKLLGLHNDGGQRVHYPAWQIKLVAHDDSRKTFESVLGALGPIDEWSSYRFFTEPNDALGGRTPLAAWRGVGHDELVHAARRYAEWVR